MHKKQLPLLFAIMFLIMLGFGIIIPVMPFFAEKLGANSFQLALLFSIYNIMQFLFAPIWGRLSDRIGRKPLILLGLAGFAITFVLFGLSTSYTELLIYRLLGGIVSAAAIPTVSAIVADLFPPEERAKGMGVIGAGVGLSFVFGPVIGGVLSKWDFSYPFYVSAAFSVLTLLIVAFRLPESLPKEKRISTADGQKSRRFHVLAAATGPLALLYNLVFIVSFAFSGLETTFGYYILDLFGMDSKDLGYMFLVMGIIAAFIQGGMIGPMVKKWGEAKVLSLGLFLYTIGFVLILFAQGFWSLALFLSLFGAGQGMIRATSNAMLTQRTTVGQGVTAGTISSMDTLGRILGPLVAGGLYGWHYASPYILGAVLVGVLLILFLQRYRSLPQPIGRTK
ncbi:MFS transporter [Brevibacillus sp. B_LB10_24]|uniref:MFS transporter n=1 Tax=Brevibacillus sp. B_LB10_24 TaxID=3380645 RepID=UPI0038BBA912